MFNHLVKKSLLTLLLIVTVIVVAACGNNGNTANSNSGNDKSATADKSATNVKPADTDKAPAKDEESVEDKAKSYYKGKTIKWIVPTSPGGSYDSVTRLFVPHVEDYTGATIVVENKTGAGGVPAYNSIYADEGNDLTLTTVNSANLMLNQIFKTEGVKYEADKFSWLATTHRDLRLYYTGKTSGYDSIEDLIEASSNGKTIFFGTNAVSGQTFTELSLLLHGLDMNAQIITGYPGSSETTLAIVSGELDAGQGSYNASKTLIESGDIIPIVQIADERHPLFPDVPTVFELTGSEANTKLMKEGIALAEMGIMFAAPPGIDSDRTKFLSAAISYALKQPDVQESLKKAQVVFLDLNSEETQEKVSNNLKIGISQADQFAKINKEFLK